MTVTLLKPLLQHLRPRAVRRSRDGSRNESPQIIQGVREGRRGLVLCRAVPALHCCQVDLGCSDKRAPQSNTLPPHMPLQLCKCFCVCTLMMGLAGVSEGARQHKGAGSDTTCACEIVAGRELRRPLPAFAGCRHMHASQNCCSGSVAVDLMDSSTCSRMALHVCRLGQAVTGGAAC